MFQGAAFGNRWWIVFGATLSMLVAQGQVILYTLGLFIKPLNQEFGWDRASISAAGGVAAIFSAITIPFVGSLIDRWGVRAVLLPIVVLCASSVALIALTPNSVVVLMLLFAITGVLGSGQGPLGYAKCVSAWFDDRRGLALGITMSGIGLGAALIPQYPSFSSAILVGAPPMPVSACSRWLSPFRQCFCSFASRPRQRPRPPACRRNLLLLKTGCPTLKCGRCLAAAGSGSSLAPCCSFRP